MAGFIPLIIIFGLVYVLIIRPQQKWKTRPAPTNLKSPWRTDEYRDAIVSVLSAGEVLVSFADCLSLETSWGGMYKENQKVKCHWGFLALTNINIRQGTWTKATSSSRGTVNHPTTEIGSTKAYGIDDIVTTSHSKAANKSTTYGRHVLLAVNGAVIRVMSTSRRAPQQRSSYPVESLFLTLTLTSGDLIEVASPFDEFEALVTSIDAAKSGALVVKNTTVAADALDQLVPLLKDGILTQEEFDRAKDGFLGAAVEVRESSVGLLRQLHSLHKSGVLTESEFNLKKWDILSKDG